MEPLKNLSDEYRVIVVEGSKFCQRNLQIILEKSFKEPFITNDWIEAFKRMKVSTPNIIIADLGHQDNGGMELLRKIKKVDHNIEIIVLSAHYDAANLLEALHIGVTDFIPKPINYHILGNAIQKALDNLKDNKNISSSITDKNKTIYDILQDIKESRSNVECVNYYKGIPIIRIGNIIETGDHFVELEVDPIQLKAIVYEKYTAIEAVELDKSFVGKVHSFSEAKSSVRLTDIKPLKYSAKRRVFVRVVPDNEFLLVVLKGSNKYNVTVNDISAKSLSFIVDKDKSLFEVDVDITINMLFTPKNKTDNSKTIIKSNAKIYKNHLTPEGLSVVVIFELDDDKQQKTLNEYIYERELEIIEEFKHIKLVSKKKH